MASRDSKEQNWSADISSVQIAAAGKQKYSGANGYPVAAAAGTVRRAGKEWSAGRWLLFICLALSCLISIAAVVVSAVAFHRAEDSPQGTLPPAPGPDSQSAVDTAKTADDTQVGEGEGILSRDRVTLAQRVQADDDVVEVGVSGEPSVALEALCNINFGNGTCLAVFNYRTGPFANGEGELFVRAGSPENTVRVVRGPRQTPVSPGAPRDLGQPQVFSQGDKFGGASFSWPCGRGAAVAGQSPRAIWNLRTEGGRSVVEVPSENKPCPGLPL